MNPRTEVRRLSEKARTDRATLHAVLDAATVAHVGLMDDGQPYVLPMAYARDGDRLLLHGSTGSRLMRLLADGTPCCVTVTILDGLVFARSAFESSMHYRSAMVLGRARVLDGDEALAGLRTLTEHLLPGRWQTLRPPTRKEIAATMLLEVPLDEWSVKISDSPPGDPAEDLAAPVWAGVLPLYLTAGHPVDAPDLQSPVPAASAVGPVIEALRAAQP